MTLANLTITAFTQELASQTPAPGGGSVSALCGAMGAALCTMVAGLTREKKLQPITLKSQILAKDLLRLVDEDTRAYKKVVKAYKHPKETDREKHDRSLAIQAGLKQAAQVPFQTLEKTAEIMDLVEEVIEKGNPNCITDGGVAAEITMAAARGAAYNVCINLRDITDKEFAQTLRQQVLSRTKNISNRTAAIQTRIVTALKME